MNDYLDPDHWCNGGECETYHPDAQLTELNKHDMNLNNEDLEKWLETREQRILSLTKQIQGLNNQLTTAYELATEAYQASVDSKQLPEEWFFRFEDLREQL